MNTYPYRTCVYPEVSFYSVVTSRAARDTPKTTRFDMNIYLKTSIHTEIVILNQSLVASIFPIRTVKPVLSCNIANLRTDKYHVSMDKSFWSVFYCNHKHHAEATNRSFAIQNEGRWKITVGLMDLSRWIVSVYDKIQICSHFKHGCTRLDGIIPSWTTLSLLLRARQSSFFFLLSGLFSLLFTSLQPLCLREQCWDEPDVHERTKKNKTKQKKQSSKDHLKALHNSKIDQWDF